MLSSNVICCIITKQCCVGAQMANIQHFYGHIPRAGPWLICGNWLAVPKWSLRHVLCIYWFLLWVYCSRWDLKWSINSLFLMLLSMGLNSTQGGNSVPRLLQSHCSQSWRKHAVPLVLSDIMLARTHKMIQLRHGGNLGETHTNTGWTYKVHTEKPRPRIKLVILLLFQQVYFVAVNRHCPGIKILEYLFMFFWQKTLVKSIAAIWQNAPQYNHQLTYQIINVSGSVYVIWNGINTGQKTLRTLAKCARALYYSSIGW